METKISKSMNQLIRRGSGTRKFLLRNVALLLLLTLGIGNAWAGGGGSSTYYSQLQAIGSTGKGYVYASKSSGDTPAYDTSSDSEKTSSTTSQNEDTYYAWAKAVRGSVFTGWSATSGSPTVSGSSNPYTVKVKESSSADGTNTGKITANWSTYTKVNVTYNPSEDGSYSVAYKYDSYNSSSKTITSGDAEGLSRTITSDDGAQTIPSYHNDIVTLQSVSGDFQGWYSDESCTTPLTGVTDNGGNPKTYTYEVPESGTVSIYAKYPHVDKYYGRLTVSIAAVPYSMPGGGTIFATKDPGVVGTYSDAIDPILNTSFGSTSQTFYLYAQPTDKRYVFRGWYSDAECTGTPLSTNKEYTYTFTASSTNSTSPTEGNVYAAFDFNLYYMQVDAQPATPGLGMVLVRDNNTGTPEYGEYSSLSSQFAYAYRGAPTATVYLYAKPKYGYKFSGWYDNPECTGTAIGTSNPQTYAATGTSTDPLNPTIVPVYAKFVPAADGDKISITYNIPDQTKGEYTASVLDIEEVDDEYVWIFTEVYNSADYTANKTISQYKTDVLRLESDPKAGYGVESWSIAGTTKTTPSQLYETSATTTGKAYGVAFGEARPFLVSASASDKTGTAYSTLREALDNIGSNKKITVVQNAYVPAGNYEIPSGVTLLVPYNSDYAIGTNQPTKSSGTTAPTPYCMLTIASGAHINVKGAISVNAIIRDQQNSNTAPTGTCGMITMESGSQIELQSGANMYVWGCVLGTGDITAHSGSTVYEALQANDYPGGTFLSMQSGTLQSKKIFPIRIYCIPNIQAYLHIEYGAQEKLSAAFASMDAVHNIGFIGTSAGLFRLTSGATLTKWYDKANDRQRYSVRGNASIENISLKVQSVVTINSGDFLMPITHNMQIEVLSGTTTIKKDIEMLPGAIVAVEKDATIDINSSAAVHVYDKDEWNINHTFANGANKSVIYGRSKTMSYAKADLADAKLDVKGSVIVNGALYTTATGGNITGSEGGIVTVNALGTKTVINQVYEKGSTSQEYHTVDISAAKLHNGDGSYVATAGSTSGDKFIYSEEQDKWLKNPMTVTWNANGGNCDVKSNVYSQTAFLGELPAAYRDGYTLAGWFTAASGGTQIAPTTKVTASTTYYAHWTPKVYNITYMDQGKVAFSGTHVDEPNAHPTKHTYGKATTLNGVNNKANALFDGWYTISNCKAESKVTSLGATAVSKDITLYAKWIPLYTLTVAANPAEYGTVSTASVANVPEGSAVTVSGNTFTVNGVTVTATPTAATTQYTYAFDHWENRPETVTGNVANIQAIFTRTVNTYTITWLDENGDEIDKTQVEYGSTPTHADPTKESDYQYDYSFAGWSPALESVTGPATYHATFTPSNRKYTITWNKANGSSSETSSSETVELDYGTQLLPQHVPTDPEKSGDGKREYTFIGWYPEITIDTKVEGDQEYVAQYSMSIDIDSEDGELNITEAETTTVTTVRVEGRLNVSGSLTTTDLILEGSESKSGEVIGTVTATNAYFDLSHVGGFKAKTWYAVAVPWQVSVTAYAANNGVYIKNGSADPVRQVMGTTFDLIYYDGNLRATNGHSDDCWKYLEDENIEIMEPGRAYMIYLTSDAEVLRFEKISDAGLHTSSLNVEPHTSSLGDKHAHWNGIANPATYHAFINAGAIDSKHGENAGQIYNAEEKRYELFNMASNKLVVGQPIFVQSPSAKTVEANSTSYAPRRVHANNTIMRAEVSLTASMNGKTDKIIIRADENKETDEYMVGQDLVKMGVSDVAPQMWVDRYDSRLCINTAAPVNSIATYPLSLFAPQAGEYTISSNAVEEESMTLYLLIDDLPIWNLSYGPYVTNLSKGRTANYSLKLVRSNAPAISTSVDNTQAEQPTAQKILLNDKVYILRGENVYSADGQLVK